MTSAIGWAVSCRACEKGPGLEHSVQRRASQMSSTSSSRHEDEKREVHEGSFMEQQWLSGEAGVALESTLNVLSVFCARLPLQAGCASALRGPGGENCLN